MTDPMLIEIPTLDIIIPEANIDWAWEQYNSLLLDVVEASLENIPGELNNIWAVWQNLHERLWSAGFDLVTAMGYTNVLTAEKNHELAYGKSLYAGYRTVFSEALRTKNLRLYLKTRLDIEKQRQTRHLQEQGLRMEYHNGLIEASVKAYNVAVQEYNAHIAALRLEGERWDAVIAANQVALKELELQLQEARLLSERERGEIRRQRALLGVQQAQAEIERLGVELLLNAARVLELEMEAQRAQLQAILVGYQVIEEQAQALSLQADVAIIEAQAGEIAVIQRDLTRIESEIANISVVNAARDAMYQQAETDKRQIVTALQVAQGLLEAAQRNYAEAQGTASAAQNSLSLANLNASDTKEDAQVNYTITKEGYNDALEVERMNLSIREKLNKTLGDALVMEQEARKKEAQATAAEALKNANIINRFTEYR